MSESHRFVVSVPFPAGIPRAEAEPIIIEEAHHVAEQFGALWVGRPEIQWLEDEPETWRSMMRDAGHTVADTETPPFNTAVVSGQASRI